MSQWPGDDKTPGRTILDAMKARNRSQRSDYDGCQLQGEQTYFNLADSPTESQFRDIFQEQSYPQTMTFNQIMVSGWAPTKS